MSLGSSFLAMNDSFLEASFSPSLGGHTKALSDQIGGVFQVGRPIFGLLELLRKIWAKKYTSMKWNFEFDFIMNFKASSKIH
jgi:hypothetical protein